MRVSFYVEKANELNSNIQKILKLTRIKRHEGKLSKSKTNYLNYNLIEEKIQTDNFVLKMLSKSNTVQNFVSVKGVR